MTLALTNLQGSLHNNNNGTNLQETSIQSHHTKIPAEPPQVHGSYPAEVGFPVSKVPGCYLLLFSRYKKQREGREGKVERRQRVCAEKEIFIAAKERAVSRLGGRNKNIPTKQYESTVSVLVVSHAGPQWMHTGPQRRQREICDL